MVVMAVSESEVAADTTVLTVELLDNEDESAVGMAVSEYAVDVVDVVDWHHLDVVVLDANHDDVNYGHHDDRGGHDSHGDHGYRGDRDNLDGDDGCGGDDRDLCVDSLDNLDSSDSLGNVADVDSVIHLGSSADVDSVIRLGSLADVDNLDNLDIVDIRQLKLVAGCQHFRRIMRRVDSMGIPRIPAVGIVDIASVMLQDMDQISPMWWHLALQH